MSYIDATGFHKDTLDDIKTRLEAGARSIFGDDIDLDPESPDGQYIALFAAELADSHDLLEAIYNGLRPNQASGAALTGLLPLNGLKREAGRPSTVTLNLGGTAGTVVKAGSLVGHNSVSGVVFRTIEDHTLTGTPGAASASAECTVEGPTVAAAGSLTKILTVTPGWTSVTNAAPATVGSLTEDDQTARVRRAQSVAQPSQGMLDGFAGALKKVSGVDHAVVYENPTGEVRYLGIGGLQQMPPHSIWAIVDGGTSADIAATMWLRKSSGCTQKGSTSATIVDSQGETQTMYWDWKASVPVYVSIGLNMSGSLGQALVDAIANAITSWASSTLNIGDYVRWGQVIQALTTSVLGTGVSVASFGLSTNGTTYTLADIPIDVNQLAAFDASRVTVTKV